MASSSDKSAPAAEKTSPVPEKKDTSPFKRYSWMTTADPDRHRAMYSAHTGRQVVVTVNTATIAATGTRAQPSVGSQEFGAVGTSIASSSAPSTDDATNTAAPPSSAPSTASAAAPPKKKRGRPLGSKNKPKVDAARVEQRSGAGQKRNGREEASGEPAAKRSRRGDVGEGSGLALTTAEPGSPSGVDELGVAPEMAGETEVSPEDSGIELDDDGFMAEMEAAWDEEEDSVSQPSQENVAADAAEKALSQPSREHVAADTAAEEAPSQPSPENVAANAAMEVDEDIDADFEWDEQALPAKRNGLFLPAIPAAVRPAAPSPHSQPAQATMPVAAGPKCRKVWQRRPVRPAEASQPARSVMQADIMPPPAASPINAAVEPPIIIDLTAEREVIDLTGGNDIVLIPQMPWSQQIRLFHFLARERDAAEAAAARHAPPHKPAQAFRASYPRWPRRWMACLPQLRDRGDELVEVRPGDERLAVHDRPATPSRIEGEF